MKNCSIIRWYMHTQYQFQFAHSISKARNSRRTCSGTTGIVLRLTCDCTSELSSPLFVWDSTKQWMPVFSVDIQSESYFTDLFICLVLTCSWSASSVLRQNSHSIGNLNHSECCPFVVLSSFCPSSSFFSFVFISRFLVWSCNTSDEHLVCPWCWLDEQVVSLWSGIDKYLIWCRRKSYQVLLWPWFESGEHLVWPCCESIKHSV